MPTVVCENPAVSRFLIVWIMKTILYRLIRDISLVIQTLVVLLENKKTFHRNVKGQFGQKCDKIITTFKIIKTKMFTNTSMSTKKILILF